MMDNRLFIPAMIAFLILIAAFYCAGGQRASDWYPRPSLEQFPPTAYKAPPTPQERASKSATEASNRVARARCKAAMQSLAISIGAPTGTTYKATMDRAKLFEDLAKQKGKGK